MTRHGEQESMTTSLFCKNVAFKREEVYNGTSIYVEGNTLVPKNKTTSLVCYIWWEITRG